MTGHENTYSFQYDGLSRLTNTQQYVGDMRNDRFVERGIRYDRNGNIKSLTRTDNGAVVDSLSYSYNGNRLTALSGSTVATYSYDANGNMTHDGANNLDLTYNSLNLIKNVAIDDTTLANYSYLADGTKLSATDAAGDGLVYACSLVYKKQNGSLALESAAFAGGRFIANQTSSGTVFTPQYHLTDHLGSTRVIIDGNSGNVTERNDYYPFGLRIDKADYEIADNRYRYNGKEEQDFVNVPFVDYGARMYDSRYSLRWNAFDPLAEQQHSGSPFAFCGNNPISRIDPDGRDWYSFLEECIDDNGNLYMKTSYAYTDAKSQEELSKLGINGIYLGEALVIFNGSYDETIGDDGTLTGHNAKPAIVTIYGKNGEDDIKQYNGLTVSSDKNVYPMVVSGEYKAYQEQMSSSIYGKDSFTYRITKMDGGLLIPPVGGINKCTNKSYISEEYLHRTNWDGKATHASKACLIIDGRSWRQVEKQLGKSKKNYIKVVREK